MLNLFIRQITVLCFLLPFSFLSAQPTDFTPRTTEVGGIIWMTDNLNVYHQGAGCFKGYTKDGVHWTADAMCEKYGRLYTIEAAIAIANQIDGWHLPTDEEWSKLEQAAGMSAQDAQLTGWRGAGTANKIKQGSYETDLRILVNGGSINKYGVSSGFPEYTYYWSSTQYDSGRYWCRGFQPNSSEVYRDYKSNSRLSRYYVRLVKDYEQSPSPTPTQSQPTTSNVSPALLKDMQEQVTLTDQQVHDAFFPNGASRTRYPDFHIAAVEVLVKILKCASAAEQNDYRKIRYYRFITTVNRQIINALNDRQWAKNINNGLEGMTAAEGNPAIVLQYLKLELPDQVEAPYDCRH